MSKKTYLLQQTINHMLDLIAQLEGSPAVMPNDVELAQQFNISRTTVRAAVEHLVTNQIVVRQGTAKQILRLPAENDYFNIKDQVTNKEEQVEKYFLSLINEGKLLPGDRFSELDLAKKSGCTTITVREFLIKFSNYGLIKKSPRARWEMVEFDEKFAKELVSFRQMIEMSSLTKLMILPKTDPIWSQLTTLLEQHNAIKADIDNRYLEFPKLDSALHHLIQDASENRFINQFFDIVSFVCHYHYQWDKNGEFERIVVALDEHIELLTHLLTHNTSASIISLEKHLDTAQRTLLRSVHGLE